jgi:hypothetical protein
MRIVLIDLHGHKKSLVVNVCKVPVGLVPCLPLPIIVCRSEWFVGCRNEVMTITEGVTGCHHEARSLPLVSAEACHRFAEVEPVCQA